MFICSTILYFDETPVGYDLHKTPAGFELKPTPATGSNLAPPTIEVLSPGNDVLGIDNEDVKQQVLKLVELNDVLALQGKFSAAS